MGLLYHGHAIQSRKETHRDVLTLTAIVVGVATTGVGLALCAAIYREYGSLDEQEILEKLE